MTKEHSTVSVILPVYNGEKFLNEAILSILGQTFSDYELIIINDGSIDGSEKIIYSFNDPRIVYVKNEKNIGIVKTLNKGFSMAQGEYIVRMDADDMSRPDRIERLVSFMNDNRKMSISGSWMGNFGPDGTKDIVTEFPVPTAYVRGEMLLNNAIAPCTMIIRKEDILTKNLAFLEKYRYENEYDFYVRAIMADLKLANIPEYLLKKRIHPDQMSNFFESRVRNVEVMEIQKEYFLFLVKRLKFIDPRYLLFMIRHAWNRFSKKASFALRRLYLKKKELDFYAIPFDKCLHDNCDIRELNDKNILDIATVAFNNPEVIGWQIRLVRKNLADKKLYTVFDNSSDRRASERIRDLCADERVAYVRLPVNHLTRSSSHGSSFNWIYSNYFKKRMADYFGFLDHDIFPVKDTHLAPLLNRQPIYGHLQERRGLWYLWAGFCFFRSDHIKRKLNFLDGQIQGIGVDTGGMNWRPIYSKLNKGDLLFPKSRHEKIRESGNPSTKLYDTSLDMIEYVGDWIHLWGSSGYKTIRKKDERDEKIRSIINKLL